MKKLVILFVKIYGEIYENGKITCGTARLTLFSTNYTHVLPAQVAETWETWKEGEVGRLPYLANLSEIQLFIAYLLIELIHTFYYQPGSFSGGRLPTYQCMVRIQFLPYLPIPRNTYT